MTDFKHRKTTTKDDGEYLAVDKVRARDSGGLLLYDDGDTGGVYVKDGGDVEITTLTSNDVTATTLEAITGHVTTFTSNSVTATTLEAVTGHVTTLTTNSITATSATIPTVDHTTGHVTTLTTNDITATTLENVTGHVTTLTTNDITATTLEAATGHVTTLTTNDITATTVNLDGGTIDSVTIGGTTPAAGSFTTIVTSAGVAQDYVVASDVSRTNTALSTDHIVGFSNLTATRAYQISNEDVAVVGRRFIIKDESGAAHTYKIRVTTEASALIDGEDFIFLNEKYGSISLYSNGSNLFII